MSKMLTRATSDKSKFENLSIYAEEGRIDLLYNLLAENKDILNIIDNQQFCSTPLHIAASSGQTLFALELLLLRPSFGTKLDASGFSPLHLSLCNGHFISSRKIAKHYPELIRVKGRGGVTPLHQLVMTDNMELLAEFLQLCPAGIEDVTAKGETLVHMAVVNGNDRALRVIVGWIQRIDKQRILGLEDDDGNTPLHVAVSTGQTKNMEEHNSSKRATTIRLKGHNDSFKTQRDPDIAVVKLLASYLKVNVKNTEGKTPLDIAITLSGPENEQIKKILARRGGRKASETSQWPTEAAFLSTSRRMILETFFGVDVYLNKGLTSEMRNALLVVAGLIVTATYQAILQPPGGYEPHHGSKTTSNIRLAMSTRFSALYLCLNTLTFFTAMLMLDLLLPLTRFNVLLKLSLSFLGISYIFCAFTAVSSASLYVVFPFVLAALLVNIPLYLRTTSSKHHVDRIRGLPFKANAAGKVSSSHRKLQFLVMSRSILERYLSNTNSGRD